MGLKKTGQDSKMFAATSAATAPASLSDSMGVHEREFREQAEARRAAMQATSSKVRIDSVSKNTTGTSPKAETTTRGRDKRF